MMVRMFVLLCAVHGAQAFSQDGISEFEKDSEIDAELRWLRVEAIVITDIATKTGMNAEPAPEVEPHKTGLRQLHAGWA